MKLTLDEKVKLNYSFIKKVEEETLALMPNEYNFLDNDVRLYIMIALVNELSKEGIGDIAEMEGDIITKIEEYIEPFYEEIINTKPEVKDVYDYITNDVIHYMRERLEDNRHIASKIDGILNLIEKLDMKQLEGVLGNIINNINTNIVAPNKSVEETTVDEIDDIDNITNDKLKDMINQYKDKATK